MDRRVFFSNKWCWHAGSQDKGSWLLAPGCWLLWSYLSYSHWIVVGGKTFCSDCLCLKIKKKIKKRKEGHWIARIDKQRCRKFWLKLIISNWYFRRHFLLIARLPSSWSPTARSCQFVPSLLPSNTSLRFVPSPATFLLLWWRHLGEMMLNIECIISFSLDFFFFLI